MLSVEDGRTVPATGALAVALAAITLAGPAGLGAEGRTTGTELWQGKEIRYELSGETESDIQFAKAAGECRITLVVDGRERTVTLEDEDIDVDGERIDVGSYSRATLNAERDSLIVNLVTTRSWSNSTSASTSGQATEGANTSKRSNTSRSQSSGKATDYHAFAFTSLEGRPIRARLKGGRSVDCAIAAGPDERTIRFDVDGGENRGTVVITPGQVRVDGATRPVDREAHIVVTATKSSLSITADGTEIWSRD